MRTLRSLGAATLAVALGLVVVAGPVAATSPRPITISVEETILGTGGDPFTSTGGVVCDDGFVTRGEGHFVGGWNDRHGQIQVHLHFVCDVGTFEVLLNVTLDFATGDTVGHWSVLRGTGAYASLHGAGSLSGDSLGPGTILDTYVGSMHIEP